MVQVHASCPLEPSINKVYSMKKKRYKKHRRPLCLVWKMLSLVHNEYWRNKWKLEAFQLLLIVEEEDLNRLPRGLWVPQPCRCCRPGRMGAGQLCFWGHPCPWLGLGARWALTSLPTQTIQWFCVVSDSHEDNELAKLYISGGKKKANKWASNELC